MQKFCFIRPKISRHPRRLEIRYPFLETGVRNVRLDETSAKRCGFVSQFVDGLRKIGHEQDRADDNEQQ